MIARLLSWLDDQIRVSIRTKLVLVIMFVCSLGVLLVGVMLTSFMLVSYHSIIRSHARTAALIVADNCLAALAFDDPRDAEKILYSLEPRANLEKATLYDAEGALFAYYRRSGPGPDGSESAPLVEGFAVTNNTMSFSTKVMLDNDNSLGWLVLEFDTGPMMQFFWSTVATLLVAISLTSLAAFFVAGRLQHFISRPILDLVNDVRLVSETRDFSHRAAENTNDEVGLLATAFNALLEQIQLRDQDLLESHGRFQNIVELTPVGVHILNLDNQGGLVFAGFNKAADDILGLDNNQFLGKTVEEAFPGFLDVDGWPQMQEAASRGRASFTGELVYDDGNLKAILDMRVFQASPTTLVSMFTDITERRRAHETLEKRERIMATLAVVSHDLLDARNPHDVLPSMLRQLGQSASLSRVYLAEAISGPTGMKKFHRNYEWCAKDTPLTLLDPPLAEHNGAAEGLQRWAQNLEQGEAVQGTLLPRGLNEEIVQEFLAAPVFVYETFFGFLAFDACGPRRVWEQEIDLIQIAAAEIGGALGKAQLLVDVQRHALLLEESVIERTAELNAVNKELASFAYSVSHDLRAPLRSINGFSQALVEDYHDALDNTAQDYLARIIKASGNMAQLIDDLLALSRVTRREIRIHHVDLAAMALESVQELKLLEPDRQVNVSIEDNLMTSADPVLIHTVLNNLLGNAWKFCSGKPVGVIEVGCNQSTGEQIFFVRDNGAGFDMKYADKLFGAFQRLHAASEFEGTGIGLATVQRIINRHGGRVWAEAAVGEGATFYFTLSTSRVIP